MSAVGASVLGNVGGGREMKRNVSIALVLLVLFTISTPVWSGEPRENLVKSNEEIKLRGTATDFNYVSLDPIGVLCSWTVEVEQVVFGPSINGQVSVSLGSESCDGYADPNVDVGDSVEVYGVYNSRDGYESVDICGSASYYIVEFSGEEIKFRGTTVGSLDNVISADGWAVQVEQVISGPSISGGVPVWTYVAGGCDGGYDYASEVRRRRGRGRARANG